MNHPERSLPEDRFEDVIAGEDFSAENFEHYYDADRGYWVIPLDEDIAHLRAAFVARTKVWREEHPGQDPSYGDYDDIEIDIHNIDSNSLSDLDVGKRIVLAPGTEYLIFRPDNGSVGGPTLIRKVVEPTQHLSALYVRFKIYSMPPNLGENSSDGYSLWPSVPMLMIGAPVIEEEWGAPQALEDKVALVPIHEPLVNISLRFYQEG